MRLLHKLIHCFAEVIDRGFVTGGDGKGNLYSEIPNGAAAFNNVGTELFSVKDNEKAIAALVDGKYYLYVAD